MDHTQSVIELMVKTYIRDHPWEFQEHLDYRRDFIAQGGHNMKTGMGNRFLGTIPVELLKQIERVDPETFRDKKKCRKFFKVYSQMFSVIDKTKI